MPIAVDVTRDDTEDDNQ